MRTIFRDAFERAELPYFNPHSFRNTLVQYGQMQCKSPEDFKAWSQNLGHEQVIAIALVVIRYYGFAWTSLDWLLVGGTGIEPVASTV